MQQVDVMQEFGKAGGSSCEVKHATHEPHGIWTILRLFALVYSEDDGSIRLLSLLHTHLDRPVHRTLLPEEPFDFEAREHAARQG